MTYDSLAALLRFHESGGAQWGTFLGTLSFAQESNGLLVPFYAGEARIVRSHMLYTVEHVRTKELIVLYTQTGSPRRDQDQLWVPGYLRGMQEKPSSLSHIVLAMPPEGL